MTEENPYQPSQVITDDRPARFPVISTVFYVFSLCVLLAVVVAASDTVPGPRGIARFFARLPWPFVAALPLALIARLFSARLTLVGRYFRVLFFCNIILGLMWLGTAIFGIVKEFGP